MTKYLETPQRQIRAVFNQDTIRVYQAFAAPIADAALAAQRFVPPFSRTRMTWIKPSFFWTMYRSDWAAKPRQERILAIDLRRSGFEWALEHACLSAFDAGVYASPDAWHLALERSPVRIQWDPERDAHLNELPYRAIQIGLKADAVARYVDEWTVRISDVTALAEACRRTVDQAGSPPPAAPLEIPYPLTAELARSIGAQ
ncbi:MAG: DUF4291 domain-containing protein [Planctomycetota bacterium]